MACAPGELSQLGQDLGLHVVVLDHRLDQEGGGVELVQAGDDPDALRINFALQQLDAVARDRGMRSLGRLR